MHGVLSSRFLFNSDLTTKLLHSFSFLVFFYLLLYFLSNKIKVQKRILSGFDCYMGLPYSYTYFFFIYLFIRIYTPSARYIQYIKFLFIPFLEENKQRDNKSDGTHITMLQSSYVTHTDVTEILSNYHNFVLSS